MPAPAPSSIARIDTQPAPIGGLNARDSIANMGPTDALRLVNWIPDSNGLRCRNGYKDWATGFGASVGSILPYFASSSTFPSGAYLTAPTSIPGKLFAAIDAGIYEISTPTSAPTLSLALSSATNAGWFSSCVMSNSAGSYTLACSEADGYFTYDGAAWLRRVAGAGATQINGVNPNNLVHVNMWKRKAWFVERDTANLWYLPSDAIAGTATLFNVGPQLRRGGSIAYTANWTLDAGEGIDDLFVIVSTNGEVLIYKGTDPASAATFAIVGTWPVGQIPLGRRGYCQYGGDLVLLSTDGVTPISAITRGGSTALVASGSEYSSKIRPLLGAGLRSSFTTFGWQMILHPTERIIMINTPDYSGVVSQQFVLSTTVNQWCLFNDIPIRCLGSLGGYTFAGTASGKVLILFTVEYDAVPRTTNAGNLISGDVIPAYSYFGTPALEKHFLMVRASFTSRAAVSVLIDVTVDFTLIPPAGTVSFASTSASLWGTGTWGTALWSGDLRAYAEWVSVSGIGYAGAATMLTSCIGGTGLASIDYMTLAGGPL